MHVCLIKCPSPFLIDEKVFPPLGLMAVGTGLKTQGHEVTITDDIQAGFGYYGLGPVTPEYPHAKMIRRLIKEKSPDSKVVIGGSHATLDPEGCLADGFDCVVCGDGEIDTEQAFLGDTPIVKADTYFLSDYPIIDRSLVDIKSYKYFINGKLATTMVTSRGCPYKCAFCCKNNSGVRLAPAEKVINEVRNLHDDFGYDAIMFFDDIFILNRKRVEAICACLKEFGITWRCFVRADLVMKHGRSLIRTMADSGCVEVGMGVESGSDKILDVINKGESTETIKSAIQLLHEEGIRVKGFFIVGLPGESQETIEETQRFLEQTYLDDMDFTIFQPYVGSPIWNNKALYDIGWNDLDFEMMFYKGKPGEYHSMVWTSSLSAEDIVKLRDRLECQLKN